MLSASVNWTELTGVRCYRSLFGLAGIGRYENVGNMESIPFWGDNSRLKSDFLWNSTVRIPLHRTRYVKPYPKPDWLNSCMCNRYLRRILIKTFHIWPHPIFFYQKCLCISCFPDLLLSSIFLPKLSMRFMFPKLPVFFYHNCLRISCFPSLPHFSIFLPKLSTHFMFPTLATFQYYSTKIIYAFHVSQACHIPILSYQNCLGISRFPNLPHSNILLPELSRHFNFPDLPHSNIFLPELSTYFMFPKFATFPVHLIPIYLNSLILYQEQHKF
jgi:hypothetical protein